MTKMLPCCARLQTNLHREEGELRRLSRIANNRISRGQDTLEVQAQIAAKRVQLADIKRVIEDHEAEHCSDEPCTTKSHYELRA